MKNRDEDLEAMGSLADLAEESLGQPIGMGGSTRTVAPPPKKTPGIPRLRRKKGKKRLTGLIYNFIPKQTSSIVKRRVAFHFISVALMLVFLFILGYQAGLVYETVRKSVFANSIGIQIEESRDAIEKRIAEVSRDSERMKYFLDMADSISRYHFSGGDSGDAEKNVVLEIAAVAGAVSVFPVERIVLVLDPSSASYKVSIALAMSFGNLEDATDIVAAAERNMAALGYETDFGQAAARGLPTFTAVKQIGDKKDQARPAAPERRQAPRQVPQTQREGGR